MPGRVRTVGLLALGAAMAMSASACGVRWTGGQKAEMSARYSTERGRTASATGGATEDDPTAALGATPTAAAGQATGDPAAAAAASGGPGAATTTRPCAAHSDAPGITDREISIGTLNSLSGPLPGLGASHLAATRAYIDYRNSTGGICGRKVKLVDGDDGGDNATARSVVASMAPKIFAMVPGIAGGGDGSADILTRDRIPAVGTSVSPQLDKVPTYYGVRPTLPSYDAVTAKYRYLIAQGVRTAAVVYVAAASAPQQASRDRQLMEAAGIKIVLDLAVPLTTLSWDSAARAVANSKADYLFFVYDQGGSAAMARSLAGANYHLKYADYIVAYGSNFIDLAGPAAAEGSTSWIDSLPVEDGGKVPEQATYLTWMRRTAPGAALDPFAALGWARMKAMLDVIDAVPGPLSRDALLAQVAATHAYDAGGLIGPIDLGGRQNKGCLVAMIVRGGKWERLTPASGFLC